MPFALLIPDMIINHTQRIFFPTPSDKITFYMKTGKNSFVRARVTPHTNT